MQSIPEYPEIGACRHLYDIQTLSPHQSPPQADDPSPDSVLAVIQTLKKVDIWKFNLVPSTSPDSSILPGPAGLAWQICFHIPYLTDIQCFSHSDHAHQEVEEGLGRQKCYYDGIQGPPEPNSDLARCLELELELELAQYQDGRMP